ncbi:hypothetical protein GXW83_21715 [Streptacidiphilus sp. PB12-B1b]|uniref:NHL repeat-containing protein n=1 Tax=Streptacidiphilus sp. PB12-B1b TaxID=2705012 RepID=UPI0015FC636A|nr:NHL repeat-containing protein [Streptacidiphilus sp. PB12-B1b]QMU77921.1 hypothetical protein GXW83_21715 [Streptacidiphilus sp. PB12-B1b]
MPMLFPHPDRTPRRIRGIVVPALAVVLVGAGSVAVAATTGHSSAAAPTPATAAVATSGTLSVDHASVVQGGSVTFSYATPAAKVNAENWIGVYADPGNGPVNQVYVGASTSWQYAASASGTVSFSTSALAPGSYVAYYLYDNGYTWLAQPVDFTVTAAPPVTPPAYHAEFGSGTLNSPSGVALDASGNVWVSDTGNNRVVEFSASGADIGGFTPSGSYALNGPTAIAVNAAGDVYVADTGDNRVVEYTSAGAELAVFGTAGGSGELNAPSGVAVNASGQVLVSDTGDNRVVEFAASGGYASSFNAKMGSPTGITVDGSGDIWVANSGLADAGPDAVMEYSASGTWLATLGTGETSVRGGLSDPSDVALDASGHAFVADPDYGWVEEFDTSGPYLDEFGETQPGLLSTPQALAVNGAGDVFVTDTGDNQIVEFAPGG